MMMMIKLSNGTLHPVGFTDLFPFPLTDLQEEDLGFATEGGTTHRPQVSSKVSDFGRLSITAKHATQTAVRQDTADEAVIIGMVKLSYVADEANHVSRCDVVVTFYDESQALECSPKSVCKICIN